MTERDGPATGRTCHAILSSLLPGMVRLGSTVLWLGTAVTSCDAPVRPIVGVLSPTASCAVCAMRDQNRGYSELSREFLDKGAVVREMTGENWVSTRSVAHSLHVGSTVKGGSEQEAVHCHNPARGTTYRDREKV
ncbi:hypothetical protein QR685DRAFT_441150 [Neurospora intermedia]|uniref:Uncharacterized protein n=1 Tax=Neurospora intermedia TaxID=5142 RepID=A0ABR3DCE8_NEUIN